MRTSPLKALSFCILLPAVLGAAEKKSVVLIAGKPSHGPGTHEHNAGVQLLAKCLKQGAREKVDVHVHLNADWPSEDELGKADAVLIYADGFTGHPALAGNHLEQLRAQTRRGCGFLAIHWATEVPKEKGGAEFLEWMGGYCEPFWSVNPVWTADFKSLPPHPVTSGVKPFSTRDEWYYHMRFRPGMQDVFPILTALPPENTLERPDGMRSGNPDVRREIADKIPQHVAWAAEREGGGRGFGFTGGHFHKGWGNENQRKLVLNAILWAARAEVPAGGVESTVTPEELEANLDPKTSPKPAGSEPLSETKGGTQSKTSEPNPLLTPQQAMAQMALPPGFKVDLVASEPLLTQPIAFCWDHRARLWVVEGHTYPARMGPDPAVRADNDPQLEQLSAEESKSLFGGRDRILIFSDEDGDGRYETRKVFLENLNLVSGIEVGYGGVYLGAAPFFLHIPLDASGDRPAGQPRVLADGFGWQDTHETLNSFLWGPDGWLYGCHGVFTQANVRNRTGPSGPRVRVPMNCAYWRWHPVEQKFEVFAHGTSNPWGLDYNAKGQLFSEACVIPHFWHVIQGAYYLRQSNPLGHFNSYVYKNVETIADHTHFVGKQSEKNPSADSGGGHAHCGLAFYDGTLFPPEFRDRPYLGNIHGKRLNSERLLSNGSGYRAAHGPDFLVSNDFNFTAVTIKTAPDGSLLVSDWYDRQKCHSRQSEIWDRSNGRIYRIRTADWKPWKDAPDLWEPESTLKLQLQENGWLSRMARRVIGEHSARRPLPTDLVEKAEKLLAEASAPETRLRLMWWLHASRDSGNPRRWLRQLKDSDPDVRLWAIQLGVESGNPTPEFLAEMKRLAREDSSPVVRLALCSAVQRLPVGSRWELMEPLIQHAEDAGDPNIPQMIWYALEPLVPKDPARALAFAGGSKLELPAALIARRVGEMRTPETSDLLLKTLTEVVSAEVAIRLLDALLDSVKDRGAMKEPALWNAAYEACSRLIAGGGDVQKLASLSDRRAALGAIFKDLRCLGELRRLSSSREVPADRRIRALRALVGIQDPELLGTLGVLFEEGGLRLEVLRLSGGVPAAQGTGFFKKVLEQFSSLNTEERAAALTVMASRVETAQLLLDAVQEQRVPRGEIPVFAARQISALNSPKLVEQLEKVWGVVRSGGQDAVAKSAEAARLRAVLTNAFISTADLSNGRQLFKGSCGQCHQLYGEGGRIGPDLTGSNRASVDYLLENVTDPNAVIGKDYELNIWNLKDGRIVSGMLRQDNSDALTVQTFAGEEQIAKASIQSVEKPGVSMMPAGLFSALTQEQLRDLVGYLRAPSQVPLPGEKPTSNPPDFFEGESLGIVSAGLRAGVQAMGQFRDGIWSGNKHLWWRQGKVGDILELAVPVSASGRFRLKAVLTRAPDYGVVGFRWDGKPLGGSVDLFGSKVSNTQELALGEVQIPEGAHVLGVEILGANPDAKPGKMFGLDYLRLDPIR